MRSLYFTLVLIFIAGFAIGYIVRPSVTGYAAVSGGQTTSLGEQTKTHPNLGAVKGYMFFTVQDSYSGVVSKVVATNITVYLVKNGQTVGDWTKVRDSASDLGNLDSIDSDDTGTRCGASSFVTDIYYDDENGNNAKDSNEKDVYAVKTDSNGCFAILAKPGNWDIYT